MKAVSIQDVHGIGDITDNIGYAVARAMNNAPDYRYVLENRPNRIQPLSWFFGQFASRLALRYGRIIATSDQHAGIFAFAPGNSPSLLALLRAGALALPRHFGWVGTWRAFLIGLHLEKHRLALVSKPHWYVLALGVAPDQQGMGKGRALIEQILQLADADGVPTYLEVFEPHLIALYGSMGFAILQQFRLPGGLNLWCLQRLPHSH